MPEKVVKSEAEWRDSLTPEQFRVLRRKGTERAFSHPHGAGGSKGAGVYCCAACGAELFDADAKFDSGTGWPSFFAPIDGAAVDEHDDRSFFMRRTEIVCAACDGHLGHVFNDGPPPTGLRYCMNGVALEFRPADAAKVEGDDGSSA